MKYVSDARCIKCRREYPAVPGPTTCACGGILDIVHDYAAIRQHFSPKSLTDCRDYSMQRYRPPLPVEEEPVPPPLRVGQSPLYKADRPARALELDTLCLKDDGQNFTSSLEGRASVLAVVEVQEAGAGTAVCSSTSNTAPSPAGNAVVAGLPTYISVPSRVLRGKVTQLRIFGATVISVEDSYEGAFELPRAAIDRWSWYNRNTVINPYLPEGEETIALEVLEQFGWQAPDYVAPSVGDGYAIAGVWKGLKDLCAARSIDQPPGLTSAQTEDRHPLNRAVQIGRPQVPMGENALADSITIGVPRNPDKALRAIRRSDGVAANVSDGGILEIMHLLSHIQGVSGESTGVAGIVGVKKIVELGPIPAGSTVMSIVTGNGLKDVQGGIRAVGEPVRVSLNMDVLPTTFAAQDIQS